MIIMGLDTALAICGYAVAKYDPAEGQLQFLAVGCWITRPDTRAKKHVDLSCRWMSLYRSALDTARRYEAELITVEALAFPMGRVRWRTISALARVRAIADAVAVDRRCVVVESTPQAIKKVTAGRANASKDEVISGVRRLTIPTLFMGMPAGQVEHAADAAGSIFAALPYIERVASLDEPEPVIARPDSRGRSHW